MNLFAKKNLVQLIAEANDPNVGEHGGGGLKRTLSAFNLTMLGIGAIIGAGIFSLTGGAAANFAGPGIAYSFIVGGILCALAGLCYAELAAMIPVAGSAYAYSYATMGELIAWIIGWDLVLEYAFGAVTVASAWSGYLFSILHKTLGIPFSPMIAALFKGPFETIDVCNGAWKSGECMDATGAAMKLTSIHGVWNIPATFVALLVGIVLYRGIKESAWVNNIIVIVKVTIVIAFIALGIGLVTRENLIVNPMETGLGSIVPPQKLVDGVTRYGWGLGFGQQGVFTAAAVVFFAYIGFDAVSTTAQEAKNPQRDLPIGILASLLICTLLYILVALTLTGVVHYTKLNVPDPIAVGIDQIVKLRGWTPWAQKAFTFAVKFGAISGLSSVILVMMLGQTRVFYAMSSDGLLPWFKRTHATHSTPHIATVVTAVFVAICGGVMPMSLVGELVSIGTLLAFVLVCIGVPILRVTQPDVERPFRVRAPWVVGILGALACLWVMSKLPMDTWIRLLVWLVIGMVIYYAYGRKHSRVQKRASSS